MEATALHMPDLAAAASKTGQRCMTLFFHSIGTDSSAENRRLVQLLLL
jgi:hypothetical protein